MNAKREDKRKIHELMELRKELAENKQLKWDQILFVQIRKIQATAREHAAATYPIQYTESKELAFRLWTQLKRFYNIYADNKKKIIGVPHRLKQIDTGNIKRYFFEEIAYKGTAGEAKKHQDKLNKGGLEKSAHLAAIDRDPKLKQKHDKEIKELLRRAGIQ